MKHDDAGVTFDAKMDSHTGGKYYYVSEKGCLTRHFHYLETRPILSNLSVTQEHIYDGAIHITFSSSLSVEMYS